MTPILRILVFITFLYAMPSLALHAESSSDYHKFNKYQTDRLIEMGYDYSRRRNMPDSALIVYTLLSHRYSHTMPVEEKKRFINVYNGLWFTYFFYFFDCQSGNQHLQKALDLCEETGESKARCLFYMGCMHQGMAEISDNKPLFEDAIDYYRKALVEVEANPSANKDILLASVANVLGGESYFGDISNTSDYMSVLRKHVESGLIDPDNWIYRYVENLYNGLTSYESGDYQDALNKFDSQIEMLGDSITNSNRRYMISAIINRSKTLLKSGEYDAGVDELKDALAKSMLYDTKELSIQILSILASFYKNRGNKQEAMECRNLYFNLRDSILTYQQLASVKDMGIYNQMKQIDSEMNEMKRLDARKSRIIEIVSIIAAAVLALLSVIIVKNRRLNRMNRILYTQNEERIKAENERNRLLIEHETKSGSEHTPAEVIDNGKYRNSILSETFKDEIMAKVLNVMENSDEIYQSGFKGETLSALTGINYKYISQVINERCGCNFNVFLNEYRVKHACRIINTTDDASLFSIEGLANSVGFKSRNAFTLAFKKFTGLNPSEYLKIAKSNRR